MPITACNLAQVALQGGNFTRKQTREHVALLVVHHVAQRRPLEAALGQRAFGVALEVDDREPGPGVQELAQVVVAVDADPLPGHFGPQHRAAPVRQVALRGRALLAAPALAWTPALLHAQTFSHSPAMCAAGLAAVRHIRRHGLVERCAAMGRVLHQRLEPLRKLRKLDKLSDEDMVNYQRINLLDSTAPNPSVETLLHAFLPHKFIDHVHSTAVLALTVNIAASLA